MKYVRVSSIVFIYTYVYGTWQSLDVSVARKLLDELLYINKQLDINSVPYNLDVLLLSIHTVCAK
jgi:hypothetical protein